MNKNILYRLYAAAFIGICLVPSVFMPASKGGSDKEKRELAEAPKIKREDGRLNAEFFDDFDNWFSEHFAFRSKLVNLDGRLKSAVFGTSNNENVIVGRDGWLYYGETADDFMNINTLSGRAIENIRHNLEIMNDYCEKRNAKFIFTSAPNKNSIYPEYMPLNYIESGRKGNYETLSESLANSGFYLDMKAALKSAESSIPLYHKTDTHWNNLGAYVGHVKLMEALGGECCPSGTSWYTKNDRLGDLAAMIYPEEQAKDTNVYNDYEFSYSYIGRFRGLDDLTIKTSAAEKDDKLLMYRDSYGEAILPYMAECFGEAEFSRVVPYRMDGIDGGAVVLEIVERNIGDLQKYAPLMKAPEAENVPEANETYIGDIVLKTETVGSYSHIFGELPEEFFAEGSSKIYVTAGGVTYEAFNCFEDKLLGRDGEASDRGFSLYIPQIPSLNNGDITIVTLKSDGTSVKFN